MAQAKEYKHIRAWGKMMGSYEYYIITQQNRALADNAPLDAVYHNDQEKRWVTISECHADTASTVLKLIK